MTFTTTWKMFHVGARKGIINPHFGPALLLGGTSTSQGSVAQAIDRLLLTGVPDTEGDTGLWGAGAGGGGGGVPTGP